MTDETRPIARRAIVTALGTGVAALGIASVPRDASARGSRWQPAMEKEDDWMNMPGRHRMVFDATSANGAGEALFFADNYIATNKSGYGLEQSQLATIVILRHFATIFGYTDPVWEKYGHVFANVTKFMDPKTKEAPRRNLYATTGEKGLPNQNVTLSALSGMGVRYAVCGLATEKIAEMLAGETKGDADTIHKELLAHVIPDAHVVPAGIVTVNRAQERGYAFAYIG